MTPLYIFDLDGTLALTEHRQHLLDNKDWRAFFAACVDDLPNLPVTRTMTMLLEAGAEVWIWSGRSDEVRQQTHHWLALHLPVRRWKLCVRMRAASDFTPDEELKHSWMRAMTAEDRQRLVAVFDDRKKVVDMWRAEGVACFQVAPGEF